MNNIKASLRVIDANLNRTAEGLRVCEEIIRFIFNDKNCSKDIKMLRHNLCLAIRNSKISNLSLISARNVGEDVGKNINLPSNKKNSLVDIFSANAQRVKESLRVLEEFLKIFDNKTSKKIQDLRFEFYTLEKKNIQRLHTLSST